MTVGAHIIVEGAVQGVGFRYFVYSKAVQLGLDGFVRNIPDGAVEIQVEGDRSLLEELIKLVNIGPRAARVTHVKVGWKTPQFQCKGFDIR